MNDVSFFSSGRKITMVVVNENEDIYSLIRQSNVFALRLWLDNAANDVHQRFVEHCSRRSAQFLFSAMSMASLFFTGEFGKVA